jgi:magnesium transporter
VDLVKVLWPNKTTNITRNVRVLTDKTKQDFLLKPVSSGILVRTDFVRAFVEADRVVFFRNDSATFNRFLEEFVEDLRNLDSQRPFRFWAVECIVCAALSIHTVRLSVLRPVAQEIMDNLAVDHSEEAFLRLYPVKTAVSSLAERLRPIVQCLSDADQLEEHGIVENPRGQAPSLQEGAEEAEDLDDILDIWSHSADELMGDIVELGRKIDDAMRFLDASLSCARNRLLIFEVMSQLVSVALGVGALVSGIFGMNLTSGLEETPGMFIGVSVGIIVIGLVIVLFTWRRITKSWTHYTRHSARYGNNRFFRELGSDNYVMALAANFEDGEISQKAFDQVLQDLQEPALARTATSPPNNN